MQMVNGLKNLPVILVNYMMSLPKHQADMFLDMPNIHKQKN